MLKDLSIGIRSYTEAHNLIKTNKLWGYVLLPGLINLVLFVVTLKIGWNYSAMITGLLMDLMGIDAIVNEEWGFVKAIAHWFFLILFRLMFIVFYLFVYKYVVLIVMAPVMALLSEKVDEIITGNKYPFEFKQFAHDVLRGIVIAMRNLFIELVIILILFLFSGIPILGWISPLLILAVECYFYGFSMIDYSNERQKMTVKESTAFIYRHKGLALANGALFHLLLLVPVIGLLVAPSYGVVAAAISTNKVRSPNPMKIN